jgi:site-specific DNA recombinase
VTAAAPPRTLRVAVYTRQSVASDLEYGSIQAQREAVAAYVRSQRGEGWVELPTHYDDHGFSGGTVERPAFQKLIADIAAGKVDIVAAYKIDRVSRSLADFTRFMTLLEKHGVGFVSTTQAFDTRTSMGRLTLNILASFSQFEREVISERITDKMQATRRRGMWTGGRPILGYDVIDKRLVVNADEASQVRAIFRLYTESSSISRVVAELKRRGWTSKSYVGKRGQQVVGCPFTKGTLHGLLTNVVYRGQMRTNDGVVRGVHEAIIDEAMWDAVQQLLRGNSRNGGAPVRNKAGATLRGLVSCGRCGSPMLHSFTTREGRRHRYYLCSRTHNEGAAACPNTRVAAGPFELFIADQVRAIGTDPVLLAKTAESLAQRTANRREELGAEERRLEHQLRRAADNQRAQIEHQLAAVREEADVLNDGIDSEALRTAMAGFDQIWSQLFPGEQERILRLLIERITYHPDGGDVDIALRPNGISALAAEARS